MQRPASGFGAREVDTQSSSIFEQPFGFSKIFQPFTA